MRKTCRNCKHSNYTPENFAEVTKACWFCGIYLANWEPKEDVPNINDGKIDELISKQAMLHAIEKCHKKCCRTDTNGDKWIHYETALNELEALPPVQPDFAAKIDLAYRAGYEQGRIDFY